MKYWNYHRALRWLAIEPEKRSIWCLNHQFLFVLDDLVSVREDLVSGTSRDVLNRLFEPPTDPVPLAEVLFELVSGEEEEFEVRGWHYTKIRFDKQANYFTVSTTSKTEHHFYWYFSEVSTFHRIAEPEEKKREPLEYFAHVQKTIPEPTNFMHNEEKCWAIAEATIGNREECQRNGWKVIKFREVEE